MPNDPIELDRIYGAKLSVFNGKLMNHLNFSRGLGFHRYKDLQNCPPQQQALTAYPDTFYASLEGVDFILLGCNGIFERNTNNEMGEFIYKNLNKDP